MNEKTNMKPKEPLLAVLLTCILGGLGHIYAGRYYRGLLVFCIPSILCILVFLYMLNPNTTISLAAVVTIIVALLLLAIYLIVDSYQCVKNFNQLHGLNRQITLKKKVFLVIGILFVVFTFNPVQLLSWGAAYYIKKNYVQSFKILSGAMRTTLLEGDRFFVDKRIYKNSDPQRGDIMVFVYPQDRKRDFVKRVVGLPNETVEIKAGVILINGIPLTEPEFFKGKYYYNGGEFGEKDQKVTVPENSYFVLGDNSMSSHDSRYWGFVDRKDVIGKAYKIFYPFERSGPIK